MKSHREILLVIISIRHDLDRGLRSAVLGALGATDVGDIGPVHAGLNGEMAKLPTGGYLFLSFGPHRSI